jgi:hypothetical protein
MARTGYSPNRGAVEAAVAERAYRKALVMFHPDRHVSAGLEAQAEAEAGLDEGLLSLPLSNLLRMENPCKRCSYKKYQ